MLYRSPMRRSSALGISLLTVAASAASAYAASRLASRARVRATQTEIPDDSRIPVQTVERMLDRFGEVVRETVATIVNPQRGDAVSVPDVRAEAERLVDAGVTVPEWFLEDAAQPEYRDPTDLEAPLDNTPEWDFEGWVGGPVEFPVHGGYNGGGNGRGAIIRPGENPFDDLGLPPTPPVV